MTEKKSYSTSTAFKAALEARLKSRAADKSRPYPVLRKLIAFDRLIARIFYNDDDTFALKGGYSLELRLGRSRTTQDIDLIIRDNRMLSGTNEAQGEALKAMLQDKLEIDLSDFFTFRLGKVTQLTGATIGGYRVQATALLGGTYFEEFPMDIAIAETDPMPLDELYGEPWLEFAGLAQTKALAIPASLQFAEKLHAYTYPWEGRTNTREKDLVDMVMLIDRGLDPRSVKLRIDSVFAARKSHSRPKTLNEPPTSWGKVFNKLASELNYPGSVEDAFKTVNAFYNSLPPN